jgi:hypothetical protein
MMPISKGYTLTWVVKNDSLFISKIQPDYFFVEIVENGKLTGKFTPINGFIPDDTLQSKFEAFTGNVFKDGLLFVDWIDGEFGILKINPNPPPKSPCHHNWNIRYIENHNAGDTIFIGLNTKDNESDIIYPYLLVEIKNGIVMKVEEDKRERKH